MNTFQDKYAQLQAKLHEGLQTLVEAPESDRRLLGVALIQIHGAMEDFVRFELVRKVPHLRAEVEDVKKSSWRELIIYCKQYLGYDEADVDSILAANAQRNEFAHGGRFDWSRIDVVRYAQYVHKKCFPNRPVPDLSYRKPAAATTTKPVHSPPSSIPIQSDSPSRPARSWTRIFVYLMLFLCLCGLAGTIYMYDLLRSTGKAAETKEPVTSSSLKAVSSTAMEEATIQPTVPTEPDTSCVIAWVEQTSEKLAARNRSMVWEEIVMDQVRGSGMTDRQFYDQVVERNPQLKADGYEFKKGKTYLLPECE